MTPLLRAAEGGYKKIIELLIAKGADVNVKSVVGSTPLDEAIRRKHPELAELLRQHGGKTSEELKAAGSIHGAVMVGNIDWVIKHLEAGADVNAKNERDGRTLLHYAARNGDKEIAEILIAEGADVNAKNDNGQTSLHFAAIGGYMEIAKLLINNGADVNAKDRYGKTPLDWATKNKHPEIADLLRKHGGKSGKR